LAGATRRRQPASPLTVWWRAAGTIISTDGGFAGDAALGPSAATIEATIAVMITVTIAVTTAV
jgi:hypothetical protein